MKCVKKPVVIEAIQFVDDESANKIIEWAWEHKSVIATAVGSTDSRGIIELHINTLEGEMTAKLLDWVIMGVQEEFYLCKPDIFEKTYYPVDPDQSVWDFLDGKSE